MNLKTELLKLMMPVDLSGLVRLGHEFDSGDVTESGPDASADWLTRCRLCGTAFRFENPRRWARASAEWRLADESRRDLQPSCHSKRALMLQHYSRMRSLIDEKRGGSILSPDAGAGLCVKNSLVLAPEEWRSGR